MTVYRRSGRRASALVVVWFLALAVLAGCGSTHAGSGSNNAISPPPASAAPGNSAPAGTAVWLDSVQMTSVSDGWALLWTTRPSGNAPLTLARTSDGGRTWTRADPGGRGTLASGQVLLDAASDQRAGLAVTTPGGSTTVYGTSDGGTSWRQSAPVPAAQPVALDFSGSADGWLLDSLGVAMGSNPVTLFRTTDGGRHWAAEARSAMGAHQARGGLPAGCDKSGMSFGPGGAGWITSFCNSLAGAVLTSADGGQQWQSASLPLPQQACQSGCAIPAPQFAGNTTFLQVGDFPAAAYLLVSTDAGAHWTTRRLPAGAGAYPRTQWFSPAAGITVAAGSQEAVGGHAYLTADGGQTWHAVPLSRPFGASGVSFDFVSPADGFAWVPGLTAASRSRVLYQTSNSGLSWKTVTPTLT